MRLIPLVVAAGVPVLCAGAHNTPELAVAVSGEFASPVDLNVASDGSTSSLSLGARAAFHRTTAAVEDPRLIGVPGSTTVLALWSERSAEGALTPHYAVSFDGVEVDRVRATSYAVRLWHGEFEPALGAPAVADVLRARPDSQLFLVQFETQPLPEFLDAVRALGAQVHKFVANHAYAMRMDVTTRTAVEALPFVRWTGELHPAYKLEEHARANLASLPLDQIYNVQVFEKGPAQKGIVAARIRAIGGVVMREDSGAFLLRAKLAPSELVQVAGWDEVHFIDRWGPYEADMDIVREGSGANFVESTLGFTGTGVRGEVIDTGFDLAHVDLQGTLVHGPAPSVTSHGTSTAGIVFGDGLGDANGRGLIPDGQAIVVDWSDVNTGPTRYTHTGELVTFPWFAVFQTASVGSPQISTYSTTSADTDTALFDFNILHFQSQSNTGSTLSRPQAWAKNIISCGGIRHNDNASDADDCWNCGPTSASTGPASDGRLKPDLAHYYDGTLTATCCGSSYTNFGGTSGATPITAGISGIFFEMWHEGVFGNPTGGSVFASAPNMTTSKAMLINTAHQWTFSGASHDLRRTRQGWGRANAKNLYDARDDFLIVDETDVLQVFQSTSYDVAVGAGEPEFKATLVYADPAGNPAVQSQHRVNDLTLKVTSPSGTVYWGNNGLDAGNWSTPGGVANTVDTTENVFVQNPEPGSWTVEVSADEINEDGHVETPGMDVDYALVVRPFPNDPTTTYCSGKVNSLGCVPFMTHSGTPSVSATTPFALMGRDVVPNEIGFIIYGVKRTPEPELPRRQAVREGADRPVAAAQELEQRRHSAVLGHPEPQLQHAHPERQRPGPDGGSAGERAVPLPRPGGPGRLRRRAHGRRAVRHQPVGLTREPGGPPRRGARRPRSYRARAPLLAQGLMGVPELRRASNAGLMWTQAPVFQGIRGRRGRKSRDRETGFAEAPARLPLSPSQGAAALR